MKSVNFSYKLFKETKQWLLALVRDKTEKNHAKNRIKINKQRIQPISRIYSNSSLYEWKIVKSDS